MASKVQSVMRLDPIRVSDAITRPANTTAYTAGDAVSDATGNAMFEFDLTTRSGVYRGEIMVARITSSAGSVATALDGELWLFRTAPAAVADNANWTVSDAEVLERIGIVEFNTANWRLNTNNCTCDVYPNIPFIGKLNGQGGGLTLYGQLVARNAYTPASAEVFTVELVLVSY